MRWLVEFSKAAASTDNLVARPNHAALLCAGLVGEMGSVLAEFKKEEREREAYPLYRNRMEEEIGDFLWYFVRLVDVWSPDLIQTLTVPPASDGEDRGLDYLELAAAVGRLADPAVPAADRGQRLREAWAQLAKVAAGRVDLEVAAAKNLTKTKSRWPVERVWHPPFDEQFPEWEQLPRALDVEFKQLDDPKRTVILRCRGLNFGDRLTDNIALGDGYRFHDVFHFAYAVFLGWSPVIRALMRTKRKSDSTVDEAQDGARAVIIEEGVSAMVFSRGKEMAEYAEIHKVDYDLLKQIQEFVAGYEVESVDLWQWERAILEGFRVFRLLHSRGGGTVRLNLEEHTLTYFTPAGEEVR